MLPTPVADGIEQHVSDALVLPQLIPYFRQHAPGVALLRHGCEHSIMLRVQHFRVAAAID